MTDVQRIRLEELITRRTINELQIRIDLAKGETDNLHVAFLQDVEVELQEMRREIALENVK